MRRVRTYLDGQAPVVALIVTLHLVCAALWSLALPAF